MYIMTDQRWVPRLSEYIGIYANTPSQYLYLYHFEEAKGHDVLSLVCMMCCHIFGEGAGSSTLGNMIAFQG